MCCVCSPITEKKLKGLKGAKGAQELKVQQGELGVPSIVCPEGNTPLMFACAAGHGESVRTLLDAGARVEDHNENGHTPLMEAASAGHVQVARMLVDRGASINTHSNEFKESALTLACYKGEWVQSKNCWIWDCLESRTKSYLS